LSKRKHVRFDGRGNSGDAVTAEEDELSDIDTDDLEGLIH
jgi:hypothetical protein